ncbi:TORC2 complex subunit TSC11 PWA37_001721 [Arxiozyma heterogenica]|uniref:Uncharacterized protein n=1 Tax=Arxiozyma heterogenica TaxID=278026 RepID=A0AAN8A8S0_9SACH|nr:hypothetical protein RI543_002449 [Kazachstania heterogenica]
MNKDNIEQQNNNVSKPSRSITPHYNTSNIRNSIYNTSNNAIMNSNTDLNNDHSNKKSLVLATSFSRTKRNEPHNIMSPQLNMTSPISPYSTGLPKTSITKSRQNLKLEIEQLENELFKLRSKKQDTEKFRDTSETAIFSATYSTEHLQKHSQRIRTNTQIREIDMNLKKLERQLETLKSQYKAVKDNYSSLNSISDHEDSSSEDHLENTNNKYVKSININETNAIDTNNRPHNFFDIGSTTLRNISSRSSSFDPDDCKSIESKNNQESNVFIIPKMEASKQSLPEASLIKNKKSPIKAITNTHPVKDKMETATLESATWYISDYMESLQENDISKEFILEKSNNLIKILKDHPEIRNDLVLTSFMKTIKNHFLRDDCLISATTYRVCRYLINGPEFIKILFNMNIETFLEKSLMKDNKFQVEKEQALKLIQRMSEYENGITTKITQILINCIERNNDILKVLFVETLLEFCIKSPKIVNKCQGIHILSKLLQECSSFELSSVILDTILSLMEYPATRIYYIDDFDITVLSSVFSDMNTKKTLNIEKLQSITILITKALKNYAGFMLYCMNNFKPLKDLLIFFQVPLCAHYLIDIFLDILTIKPLSLKGRAKNAIFNAKTSEILKGSVPSNQVLAITLEVLSRCKFENYLIDLINCTLGEDSHTTMSTKARLLLSEYLNLRSNLLNVSSLPSLKKTHNTDVSKNQEIFQFCKTVNKLNRGRNTIGMGDIDSKEQIRQYTKSVKTNSLVTNVDDLRFRKMVLDSKVLQTKDFSHWNWDVIQELLEGPLMNKRQLEELARSTKFIRRLLVFYRPLRLRFSNIDKGTRLAQKYIQVGCKFFKVLTRNPEGLKIFLEDTKIVPQLASLLYRAMEGNTNDNIFSEETLKTKIVDGYFKFVGVLTETLSGIKILTKWNFFTVIYKMFQEESFIGMKFLLLTLPELNLVYSVHCRVIFGKALTATNKKLRIKATKIIGDRLNNLNKHDYNLYDSNTVTKLQKLKLELLTRQLYDLSSSVVAIADKALYEYILNDDASINTKISIKKFLNQMVFIGSPILFELLSKPLGFKMLDEIDFVEKERKSWLLTKNREYVIIMEQFLSNGQSSLSIFNSTRYNVGDKLPLHFYESLSKTEGGISLLTQSGDLLKCINVIKKYVDTLDGGRHKDIDPTTIKSMLWCLGYIGSTVLGISLLDNYSIVTDIVRIAYDSDITSIKFTAFFVLGLINKTCEGYEILDELDWNCTLSIMGKPVGVSLPSKLDKFLAFKEKAWTSDVAYKEETFEYNLSTNKLICDSNTKITNYCLDELLDNQYYSQRTVKKKN